MIQFAIDHLWQSTLFAACVAVLTLAFRTNGARIRFGLWLSASLKFLVPFPLIVAAGRQLQWTNAPSFPAVAPWPEKLGDLIAPSQTVMSDLLAPSQPVAMPSFAPVPIDSGWSIETWVWVIWACGVGAVVLWQTWQWLRLRAVLKTSSPLPIAAPIKVYSSPALFEPGLLGVFRPRVMLPNGIADHLTPQQLDLVLAHELCHWRRRDNLTAVVHMLVEALFWFHPLVWWIGRRLIAEREHACDEAVLAGGGHPRTYAESLVAVCRFYVQPPGACAAGVSGGSLRVRVERIIRNHVARRLGRVKIAALATLVMASILAPLSVGLLKSTEAMAKTEVPAPKPIAQPPIAVGYSSIAVSQQQHADVARASNVPLADHQTGPVRTEPPLAAPESTPTPAPEPVKYQLRDESPAPPPAMAQVEADNDAAKPAAEQVVLSRQVPQTLPAPQDSDNQIIAKMSPDVQMHLNNGNVEFGKKNYKRALAEFGEAIRLAPDNAGVYVIRGNAYTDRKDYRRAIADYDEAIRLKPDFAVALYLRGAAYAATGDYKRAIADYSEAIRLQRDFVEAYLNRGDAYSRGYPFKESYSRARRSLANAKFDLAIADYDQAIRLKPDLAAAYLNRGSLYASLYDYPPRENRVENQKLAYDHALADFEQAIRLLSESKNGNQLLRVARQNLQALLQEPQGFNPDRLLNSSIFPDFSGTGDAERAINSGPPAPEYSPP